MPDFPYATLMRRLEAVLRDADALQDVEVQQGKSQPTSDQCPAVRLILKRCDREAKRIGDSRFGGRPDDLRIHVSVQCWQFSGQGSDDASRLREELINAVVDTLRNNPCLKFPADGDALVDYTWVGGIDFDEGGDEAVTAVGTIALECWAQA